MKKDLSAFMPEALGHPYPGEVLRTAQEVAEKLRPFYESANFSMFNAASEQAARLNKSLRTINAINVKCAKQLEVASALTRHIDPALCQALNKMPPMPAIPGTPMLGLEQQKLFNDLTTASQTLQHTLGAKLDLLSLDRAMQVERVLSKLDLYVPNLADYDHIPLKDMLSTLIDCRPEEYADVLKKRFPRPKKHSKRKKGHKRKAYRKNRKKRINELLYWLGVFFTIHSWLLDNGFCEPLSSSPGLFDNPPSQIEHRVDKSGEPNSHDEQLCNPGVCCGRNSEAEGSTSAENRGQTHAQTSKLI